jgi:UDP-galactopyranose mutase
MREPVIILGGGLAGLSAAAHLDGEAPVYERQTSVGGLCRQLRAGGFRFDAVPHVLHFGDPDTFEWVKGLLGQRLIGYRRQARVATHGVFVRYPFQAHLFGLPQDVTAECVEGRLAVEGSEGSTDSFDAWIATRFGDGIARHFMRPYNTKFWTLPPAALTCEWLDGLVPVPTVTQMLRGAQGEDPTEYGYNVDFWYPSPGGLGALTEALVARLPRLSLGRQLVRLDPVAHTLEFADGEVIAYDTLLSSIPLPELPRLVESLPVDVRRACEALRWTSIAVVHLGVRGPAAVPWHWVYVPDPDLVFYRVGLPSHYAPDAAPEGCHILSAEIAYSAWRPLARETLIPRVVEGLKRLRLLRPEADVLVAKCVDLRYGYPIYDHAYACATETIHDYLAQHDIVPLGRFGSWRYLSVEQTLRDAERAALDVRARSDPGRTLERDEVLG